MTRYSSSNANEHTKKNTSRKHSSTKKAPTKKSSTKKAPTKKAPTKKLQKRTTITSAELHPNTQVKVLKFLKEVIKIYEICCFIYGYRRLVSFRLFSWFES